MSRLRGAACMALAQFLQQRLRILQIGGVEALG
jgi:hypothetical protein